MTQRAYRCEVPDHTETFAGFHAPCYKDAFKLTLRSDDTRDLRQLLDARGTGWPERLLGRIRDLIVSPFGLKPIGKRGMAPFERLQLHNNEAVFSVDDKHVDVRIAYRVAPMGSQRQLVAITLVRVHGGLGRLYLGAILPFHFFIVKRQLERMAALPLSQHPD